MIHAGYPMDYERTSLSAKSPTQLHQVHGKTAQLSLEEALRFAHVERYRDALILGHRHDEPPSVIAAIVDLQVARSNVGERASANLLLHPSAFTVVYAENVGVRHGEGGNT